MVSDKLESLALYRSLAEGLIGYQENESRIEAVTDCYSIDRKHTVLFVVETGSAIFSTSWRETPDSREPLAVCRAEAGSFVLFLPGEPFLLKAGDAAVRMYRVE